MTHTEKKVMVNMHMSEFITLTDNTHTHFTHTCMHTCTHPHTHAHTYPCMHAHIHIHTQAHTHTHA